MDLLGNREFVFRPAPENKARPNLYNLIKVQPLFLNQEKDERCIPRFDCRQAVA